MKLTVFNGSPRGEQSTTIKLLRTLKDGFLKKSDNRYAEYNLSENRNEKMNILAFMSSDIVIIGFPLYTDAMPGLTKEFLESLSNIKESPNKPALGFFVQSGFPEAKHSYYVERYLKKFCQRLNCRYLGTIIKGNCNRIELQPRFFTKSIYKNFEKLGKFLGETGKLDSLLINKILIPEELGTVTRFLLKILNHTPLGDYYWRKELKKFNTYEYRHAMPYLQ